MGKSVKVKEVRHVNSEEDKEFLRKFGIFVLCVVLAVGIFASAKCSSEKMEKEHKTIDHDGSIISDPGLEEDTVVLRRIN